jgi:hypothetical protein
MGLLSSNSWRTLQPRFSHPLSFDVLRLETALADNGASDVCLTTADACWLGALSASTVIAWQPRGQLQSWHEWDEKHNRNNNINGDNLRLMSQTYQVRLLLEAVNLLFISYFFDFQFGRGWIELFKQRTSFKFKWLFKTLFVIIQKVTCYGDTR